MCVIFDIVCDVDVLDLIGIVKGFSGEECMIEFSILVFYYWKIEM